MEIYVVGTRELKINTKALEQWLRLANMTESILAKDMNVDAGNLRKMICNIIPTSKTVLEGVLSRTGLPLSIILTTKTKKEEKNEQRK